MYEIFEHTHPSDPHTKPDMREEDAYEVGVHNAENGVTLSDTRSEVAQGYEDMAEEGWRASAQTCDECGNTHDECMCAGFTADGDGNADRLKNKGGS